MTPVWYSLMPGVLEELRNCTDLYRYLLREGVAGRGLTFSTRRLKAITNIIISSV
jgi:hypothetical protein